MFGSCLLGTHAFLPKKEGVHETRVSSLVTDRMSADGAEQLVRLLYRYAETELDQFDHWRLETGDGPVYMNMARQLLPDWSDRMFDPLPKPGTSWQTGRFADVNGVEGVASREDVQRVIAQMRADLTGRG